MVDFKFRYKITYIDGQTYDRKHILNVQVTEEEYKYQWSQPYWPTEKPEKRIPVT